MTTPATITTLMMEHADGRPVAYVDATGVVVIVYQQPNGAFAIEIDTRDDDAADRLHLLFDGCPMDLDAGGGRQRPRREPPW